MATKYFVSYDTTIGSNHNWNNSDNWALSSGGLGGAGIPTKDDDVVFDTGSGGHIFPILNAVIIPDSYNAQCRNLTINTGFGFKVEFSNSNPNTVHSRIEIYGTLSLYGTAGEPIELNPANLAYQQIFLYGTLGTIVGVTAKKILSAEGKRIYYNPDLNTITDCPYWLKPTPPAWYSGVSYIAGDLITSEGSLWICVFPHISTVFGDDLSFGFWELRENSVLKGRLNIRITDKRQMADMYNAPDYNYTLANDIDMTGQSWNPVGGGYLPRPIGGLFDILLNPFTGNFDGQGFKISNLVYDDTVPDTTRAGLFGAVGVVSRFNLAYEIPTIQNLTMESCQLTAAVAGAISGDTWVGSLLNIVISNCLVSSSSGAGGVSGSLERPSNFDSIAENISVINTTISGTEVGLVFSYCEGVIKNCTVQGTLTGDNYLGGLCSDCEGATITDCQVTVTLNPTVNGGNYFAGLIANDEDSMIYNCSTFITLSSSLENIFYCAGFIGNLEGTEINKCFCEGTITLLGISSSYLGGFAGNVLNPIITNCYSRVVIVSPNAQYSAGFIANLGSNSDGFILQNCYASGNVSGDSYVAGFVANYSGTIVITNCYSAGIVTGITFVGGLMGLMSPLNLLNCAWYTASADNAIGDDGSGNPRTLLFPDLGTDEPDNTKFYFKTHQVYKDVPQTFIDDDSGNAIQDDTGHYVEGV